MNMKITHSAVIPSSFQQAEHLHEQRVTEGLAQGLDDVAHGRYTEMSPTHLERLRRRLQERHQS